MRISSAGSLNNDKGLVQRGNKVIMKSGKDGGQLSTVYGYWFCEFKRLFSIVLLCFDGKSREAFHDHAFDSVSWVLWGKLIENHLDGNVDVHTPSLRPVITRRSTFHKVDSVGRTWVFSLRGPWAKTWNEFIPESGETVTFGSGRCVLERGKVG
jgi:hypothetical protein